MGTSLGLGVFPRFVHEVVIIIEVCLLKFPHGIRVDGRQERAILYWAYDQIPEYEKSRRVTNNNFAILCAEEQTELDVGIKLSMEILVKVWAFRVGDNMRKWRQITPNDSLMKRRERNEFRREIPHVRTQRRIGIDDRQGAMIGNLGAEGNGEIDANQGVVLCQCRP